MLTDIEDFTKVIHKKDLDNYPIIFSLYSFEYVHDVDLDLVCSIYLEESDAQVLTEDQITLINSVTYLGGSESYIFLPVPALEYVLSNFTEDIFKEDVDEEPCDLCLEETTESINIYLIIDYGLYAHESCMNELSDKFRDFCSDCPEIMSRII